jgi:hypothetical protein
MLIENNEANLTSKTKGFHPLLLLILLFLAKVLTNIIAVEKSMNQS